MLPVYMIWPAMFGNGVLIITEMIIIRVQTSPREYKTLRVRQIALILMSLILPKGFQEEVLLCVMTVIAQGIVLPVG
jgi:hypothetical protein